MKILLVYLSFNKPFEFKYSYGLGYISSALKKARHKTQYITISDDKELEEFKKIVKNQKPEMIGFSITTSQFQKAKEIIPEIKKINNSFIICGGTHPSLRPECLEELKGADAIIRGEGEEAIVELANAIEKNKDTTKIRNIWIKKENKIIQNPIRPLQLNLDLLEEPDKDSIDYQKIINESLGENRFIFSRGCTFQCTYCSNKALSQLYPNRNKYFRSISPKKAINTIKKDLKRFKFSKLAIDNDTITLDKKWFYEFFNMYKEEIRIPFRCNIRPGLVDENMIKLLSEAGAQNVGIGVEQGNEEFRNKKLKRPITNEQIKEVFKWCDKYKINHEDFVMVGFPGENKKLFLQTVKLSRQVNLKGDIKIFTPYPATELGEEIKNKKLKVLNKFVEREQAPINYPGFSRKKIDRCKKAFPIFLKYKRIPVWVPMNLLIWIVPILEKINRRFNEFRSFVGEKVKKISPRTFKVIQRILRGKTS
ncbi:B12-binding domain-containing radical SAM protein [Candidatus Woesearchaeota archaeon]|nr:B12-binding domain-containing radical SAM protein [Candidatus Woesearchaeota archaeon]